jgi:hypothetical protein
MAERYITREMGDAYRILSTIEDDEELRARLEEGGFDPETIAKGWSLYEEGRLEDVLERRVAAEADYGELAELSREIFREDADVLDMMGLRQEQGTPLNRLETPFTERAPELYDAPLGDLDALNRLEEEGYSRERLEEAREEITTVARLEKEAEARARKDVEDKGEESVFSQLGDWANDFVDRVRSTFEDAPEVLEQLGLD